MFNSGQRTMTRQRSDDVPVAAVDIGTNTTRLLIRDGDRDHTRIETVTRLGAGVDASGVLTAASIDRTCAVLADYRARWETAGATAVRLVATSAARDAANRDVFFDRAAAVTGVRPELLDGLQEAALSFAGATARLDAPGFDSSQPLVVFDIGGGSTEFVLGASGTVRAAVSLDIGSVRITERHFDHDPPRPEELSNALAIVDSHLDDVERELGPIDGVMLIGVAGTVTTVAAVELGLATFDPALVHRFWLTRSAAEDVFRTLATEALADRRQNPGLPPARADVIVGGCVILVAILRRFEADGMLVSVTDLLDGVAASMTYNLSG
jgi:exopolyphosphatase / guanosine-5'-triphosphate,3'-diphosphate pyrophosphatase